MRFIARLQNVDQRGSTLVMIGLVCLATCAAAEPPDRGLAIPRTAMAADSEGNFLGVVETGAGILGFAPDGAGGTFPLFPVNTPTTAELAAPAVAVLGESDGGSEFVVVWEDVTGNGASSIHGRLLTFDFTSGMADFGDEFVVAGAAAATYLLAPDVAADGDGNFVVVWEKEYFTSESVEGARFENGEPTFFSAATDEEVALLGPRVSMAADGSAVVVWEQGFEIAAAQVGTDGSVTASGEINLLAAGLQSRPAVAVTGSTSEDFMAVWDSTPSGGGAGIFGRRFAAGLGGPELQIHSIVDGDQKDADVAADPDGNVVVVWLDEERNQIGGQRFSASSVYVEDEIDVTEGIDNDFTFGPPRTVLLPDGRFLVNWADAAGMVYVRQALPSDAYLECVAADSTLCPQKGRFRVDVAWRTPDGVERSAGKAVPLSDASGYFWFFDSDNVELVVKVLRACGRQDPCHWVFAAGMTDLEVEITVRDTVTGLTATYANAQGVPFAPVLDTATFAAAKALPALGAQPGGAVRFVPKAEEPDGGCGDAGGICLHHDRFRIEVSWADPRGASGFGRGTRLTRDAGYFWFFDPENVETFFKVLDGCGVNGHYWLFGAGLTDLEVDVQVIDTQTGAMATYANPQGIPFQPILDTTAFACR